VKKKEDRTEKNNSGGASAQNDPGRGEADKGGKQWSSRAKSTGTKKNLKSRRAPENGENSETDAAASTEKKKNERKGGCKPEKDQLLKIRQKQKQINSSLGNVTSNTGKDKEGGGAEGGVTKKAVGAARRL